MARDITRPPPPPVLSARAGIAQSQRGLSRGVLIYEIAVPSGEGKGGECLTYLSKPCGPLRVFTGCGNSGL